MVEKRTFFDSKSYRFYAYLGILSFVTYTVSRLISNPFNYSIWQNLTLLPSYLLEGLMLWGVRKLAIQYQNKVLEQGAYWLIGALVLKYLSLYCHTNILLTTVLGFAFIISYVITGIGYIQLAKRLANFAKVLGLLYLLHGITILFTSLRPGILIIFFDLPVMILTIALLLKASRMQTKTIERSSMKKKNPWIAAVLNILFLGSGYIYNGERKIFGSFLLVGFIMSIIWGNKYSHDLIEISKDPFMIGSVIISYFGFGYDAFMDAKNKYSLSKQEVANNEKI